MLNANGIALAVYMLLASISLTACGAQIGAPVPVSQERIVEVTVEATRAESDPALSAQASDLQSYFSAALELCSPYPELCENGIPLAGGYTLQATSGSIALFPPEEPDPSFPNVEIQEYIHAMKAACDQECADSVISPGHFTLEIPLPKNPASADSMRIKTPPEYCETPEMVEVLRQKEDVQTFSSRGGQEILGKLKVFDEGEEEEREEFLKDELCGDSQEAAVSITGTARLILLYRDLDGDNNWDRISEEALFLQFLRSGKQALYCGVSITSDICGSQGGYVKVDRPPED